MTDAPDMTIVMVTPDRMASIARTFARLRAQTIAERLEIVIVAPAAELPGFDPLAPHPFHSIRVHGMGPVDSAPAARAAGVRAARAPVVAFTEEHSFPEPEWAERLLGRFAEGFAAVGPDIGNANPALPLSWANLLTDYGHWVGRPAEDDAWHLPGHNGAYRRDVLMDHGERLEDALASESTLQWELRGRGHRLCFEPAARTHHLNFTLWSTTARVHLDWGRCFAGHRLHGAGLARRVAWILGAPLIPVVRFLRLNRDRKRLEATHDLPPGVALRLFAVLGFDGLGEWIGYMAGPGDSVRRLAPYDFHRERHLTPEDRERFHHEWPEPAPAVATS